MSSLTLTIDGAPVTVPSGASVLEAARALGIDIPTLCYLEKCGPLNSCLVCLVKINGKLVPSCGTPAAEGMVVESETEEIHEARRTSLELLFSDHVGDCLSPCHRLCPLGLNIPVMLRHIERGENAEAAAHARDALPLPGVLGRLCHHPCEQGCRRGSWDDPAAIRDLERFAMDWQLSRLGNEPEACDYVPPHQPQTFKSVAIIGAGPTGLSAAYYLSRQGIRVTVVDRRKKPGGSLREISQTNLPPLVLELDVQVLKNLGIDFKTDVELGEHVSIDGLSRGFDAILLATGEPEGADMVKIGLPRTGHLLRSDPNTCQTPVSGVFAAGAAVKPVKHLVRAMSEGRAAAECINRFLKGEPARRPEKTFSSVMGRLSPGELKDFLASANLGAGLPACDRCAGLAPRDAVSEASRCLHCDCRSSGNCVLQHYAQAYGADASRFRAERKPFEQVAQPGGIIFEPGKCILCGICVRLAELAREPLGLTFIGRGFDVRVSAPLNHSIEEGLQKVAAECVHDCPTGALVFGTTAHSPV